VLRIRTRDPVPFWPLDPGSGIGFFRAWILDLGSQTHIFEKLVTVFYIKKTRQKIIKSQFAHCLIFSHNQPFRLERGGGCTLPGGECTGGGGGGWRSSCASRLGMPLVPWHAVGSVSVHFHLKYGRVVLKRTSILISNIWNYLKYINKMLINQSTFIAVFLYIYRVVII
jgi:hypothetical protein